MIILYFQLLLGHTLVAYISSFRSLQIQTSLHFEVLTHRRFYCDVEDRRQPQQLWPETGWSRLLLSRGIRRDYPQQRWTPIPYPSSVVE